MADDVDITQAREEKLAEARAKAALRFAPQEIREGRCEECGLHHSRLARERDPERPHRTQWVCAPCRDERESLHLRLYGNRV